MQDSFRPRSENLVRTGLNLTNFGRFSAYSVLQNLQQSEIELAMQLVCTLLILTRFSAKQEKSV
jgi:hypothetical protein